MSARTCIINDDDLIKLMIINTTNILFLNIELASMDDPWGVKIEYQHSRWNHDRSLITSCLTLFIVFPLLQAILSHNYKDKITKTCKII